MLTSFLTCVYLYMWLTKGLPAHLTVCITCKKQCGRQFKQRPYVCIYLDMWNKQTVKL